MEKFSVFWVVTHRYPMSPTIFNVVVESVVRHWVSMVEGGVGV